MNAPQRSGRRGRRRSRSDGLDQQAAAGLERRPHADVDRRRAAVRQRRVDAVPGQTSPRRGPGSRSGSRARARACRPRPPRPRAGTAPPRQRIARARRRPAATRAGSWLDEPSRRRPRPAAPRGSRTPSGSASICGVALAPSAEAEVLPHRDPSRPAARSGSREQNSSASIVEKSSSNGITTISVDPEALDHVALDLERHDQLRRCLRVDDAERVRVEREHRVGPLDHLAVTDVDAVEGADRDVRGGAVRRRGGV